MRFSCPKQCFQKPIKPTHLVSNEKQFAELFWFQLHFLEKCWYDSDSNRYIIVFTVHPFLSREAPLNWPWRGRGKILYIKRWIVLYYRWRRSCDKVFPTQKLLRNSNHPTKGIKIKFQGFSSWAFYNRNIINHLQYFLFFLEAWHMVEFLKKPITVEHFFGKVVAWILFCQRVLWVGEKNKEVKSLQSFAVRVYIVSTLHGHKSSNICDFTPTLKSVVIWSMMMLKTNYSLVKRGVGEPVCLLQGFGAHWHYPNP